jgi:hypothetical protein
MDTKMAANVSHWIQKISSGWVTLATLILFILFIILVLPSQASQAEVESGGAESPDLSLYYTADQLYQLAESYGESGRAAYVRARFTFDLIWPLVYMVFLSTAISWVFQRAFPLENPLQRANLLPVLAAIFDYLENVSTSLVMARFPELTPILDVLAGVFTSLKWLSLTSSFLILVIGLFVALFRWVLKNKRA